MLKYIFWAGWLVFVSWWLVLWGTVVVQTIFCEPVTRFGAVPPPDREGRELRSV